MKINWEKSQTVQGAFNAAWDKIAIHNYYNGTTDPMIAIIYGVDHVGSLGIWYCRRKDWLAVHDRAEEFAKKDRKGASFYVSTAFPWPRGVNETPPEDADPGLTSSYGRGTYEVPAGKSVGSAINR